MPVVTRATLAKSWRLRISGILILVGVWEVCARILQQLSPFATTIFPTWGTILGVALPSFGLFWSGEPGGGVSYLLAFFVLATNSVSTLGRVFAGTMSGIALGVGLGMVMGWSRQVQEFVWPTIQLLRPVPTLALIPLFMLWFGGREVGTWLYITWAIFSMMVVYTLEAIRNIPPIFAAYAGTLGASPIQVYRTVVLPAIIPPLIGGVRVSLGVSWAIVLAAEYLGAQSGLGRILILSQTFFDTGRMVIVVLLFIAYAVALNAVVTRLLYRATRWVP